MNPNMHVLPNFSRLAAFSEEGTLDEHLQRMASMAARMLGADNCSIMLAEDAGQATPRLTVWACSGELPAAAYREAVAMSVGDCPAAEAGLARLAPRSTTPARRAVPPSPTTIF